MVDELVLAINEMVCMVANTGKPIYTLELSSEDAAAVCKQAKEMADRYGIRMEMDVIDDERADVELCFFREQIIFDTYLYLKKAKNTIPLDVLDCLDGLLFGYRSDAIQQYVDRQRSFWKNILTGSGIEYRSTKLEQILGSYALTSCQEPGSGIPKRSIP